MEIIKRIRDFIFGITEAEWNEKRKRYHSRFYEGDPDCDHVFGYARGLPPNLISASIRYPNGVRIGVWEVMGSTVKKCGRCGRIQAF